MKIKEYLSKLEAANLRPATPGGKSYAEMMQEATDIWSNDACQGYFLRAAQLADLDPETTRKVLSAFHAAFDEMTVTEAEREYISY